MLATTVRSSEASYKDSQLEVEQVDYNEHGIRVKIPIILESDTGTSSKGHKMIYVKDSTGLEFYMSIQFEGNYSKSEVMRLRSHLSTDETDSCFICEKNIKNVVEPFLNDSIYWITNAMKASTGVIGYNNYLLYFDSGNNRLMSFHYLESKKGDLEQKMCWFRFIVNNTTLIE